jgi:hypothetical protein
MSSITWVGGEVNIDNRRLFYSPRHVRDPGRHLRIEAELFDHRLLARAPIGVIGVDGEWVDFRAQDFAPRGKYGLPRQQGKIRSLH